jgi:hypothetical protein
MNNKWTFDQTLKEAKGSGETEGIATAEIAYAAMECAEATRQENLDHLIGSMDNLIEWAELVRAKAQAELQEGE